MVEANNLMNKNQQQRNNELMLQVIEMNLLHDNMSILSKAGSGAQGSIYLVK